MKILLPVKNFGKLTLMEVNQSVGKLLNPNMEPWEAPNVTWKPKHSVSNDQFERNSYEGHYQGIKTHATVTHNKKTGTYTTTAQVFPANSQVPAVIRSFVTDFRNRDSMSEYDPIRTNQTLKAASDDESRETLLSAIETSSNGNPNADLSRAINGFRKLQKAYRRHREGTLPKTDTLRDFQIETPEKMRPKFKIRRSANVTPQGSLRLKLPKNRSAV